MSSRRQYLCRKRGCTGCVYCRGVDVDAILKKIREDKQTTTAQEADGARHGTDEAIADEGQHQAHESGRGARETDAAGESEADAGRSRLDGAR